MTGRAGKARNIWLVWLIWPLITLGIYHFVWWYKINREARDFDKGIAVEPVLSLLAILIGWIIIVPPFVSVYRTGERIGTMQRDAGMDRSCNGWLGLVLSFFAGLHSLYYQYELNLIWARLGHPEAGSLVALPAGQGAAPGPAAPDAQAPGQAGPTQAAPTQAGPTQADPTQAAPTQAAPTQAAPTQAASTQAAPTQAAPGPADPGQAARSGGLPSPGTPSKNDG